MQTLAVLLPLYPYRRRPFRLFYSKGTSPLQGASYCSWKHSAFSLSTNCIKSRTNTRRANKDERTDRAVRVLQARAGAAVSAIAIERAVRESLLRQLAFIRAKAD